MCIGCRSMLGDLWRVFLHISVMNIRAENTHIYSFATQLFWPMRSDFVPRQP